MKSIYRVLILFFLSNFFCTILFSQNDSSSHNGIWELGMSRRFSSKPFNEKANNRSTGNQYTLDIGHEWDINSNNKLGFIISTQFLTASSDGYITPMFTWNFSNSKYLSHRFAVGPIIINGHNNVDFINGYSLSYDLEITDKISISNRLDLLYDRQTKPILSFSPGIKFKGNYCKYIIITGGTISSIIALRIFSNFSNSF